MQNSNYNTARTVQFGAKLSYMALEGIACSKPNAVEHVITGAYHNDLCTQNTSPYMLLQAKLDFALSHHSENLYMVVNE